MENNKSLRSYFEESDASEVEIICQRIREKVKNRLKNIPEVDMKSIVNTSKSVMNEDLK